MTSSKLEIDRAYPSPAPELGDRRAERRHKLQQLRATGVDPFPHVALPERVRIADLLDADGLAPGSDRHWVAGRVISRRKHGRITFIDLRDQSASIELCIKADKVGPTGYELIHQINVGDIIGAEGTIDISRHGEKIMVVERCQLLTKALLAPPARDQPIQKGATRLRFRELDLLASEETRALFRARAATLAAIRDWMSKHEMLEVETPILHLIPSGSAARPFTTYHNALDKLLSLRVSGELHLKRCVVGGLGDVYEIGRCFRNEGLSPRHSPEFTLLEWMQTFADYKDVANFAEEMIGYVAGRLLGTTVTTANGKEIHLKGPWRRVTFRDIVEEETGIDIFNVDRETLHELLGANDSGDTSWAELVEGIYARFVEPNIVEPTVVFDFPAEGFPLARPCPGNPDLAEHFDVVINGVEIVSGDTDQTDPDEQRRRLLEQRDKSGNDGAAIDEEFLRSLELGMPPVAGAGIGVDRLLAVLMSRSSIREVILFPSLKRRNEEFSTNP